MYATDGEKRERLIGTALGYAMGYADAENGGRPGGSDFDRIAFVEEYGATPDSERPPIHEAFSNFRARGTIRREH